MGELWCTPQVQRDMVITEVKPLAKVTLPSSTSHAMLVTGHHSVQDLLRHHHVGILGHRLLQEFHI